MYELVQVADNTFYIESPAKIGVVRTGENEVCLIDSGNDKDAGKKVKRILDERGWILRAIYNTHSHADHVGGNNFLQSRTGCSIYAPGIECDITLHPLLEPVYLYGGNPPSALRHKFLMAQESEPRLLTAEELPEGWEIISLPGHSFDMVGFRTPDNVVFLADCLSSQETLEKYKICFLVDPGASIETLQEIQKLKAALFIPSHATPAEDITALADLNIRQVRKIAWDILKFCQKPQSSEQILRYLFDQYELRMTMEQHALVGSTVRSYLSWMTSEGRLEPVIEDNLLLWKTAQQDAHV